MNTIPTFLKQLDKLLHLAISFALTMTLGYLLLPFGLPNAIGVAAIAVLAIGAGKEVYDKQHPLTHTADVMDFVADVIGVACAALLAPAMYAKSWMVKQP